MEVVDDQPTQDQAAARTPPGPAGQVPGAICRGTANVSRYYSFAEGDALAAAIFLAKSALQQQQGRTAAAAPPAAEPPEVIGLRRSMLIFPITSSLGPEKRLSSSQACLQLRAIIGSGAGTTVYQAWHGSQPCAAKPVDSLEDERIINLVWHELRMLQSQPMSSLLWKATVGLVGGGMVAGSPFMATELMAGSAEEGEMLHKRSRLCQRLRSCTALGLCMATSTRAICSCPSTAAGTTMPILDGLTLAAQGSAQTQLRMQLSWHPAASCSGRSVTGETQCHCAQPLCCHLC